MRLSAEARTLLRKRLRAHNDLTSEHRAEIAGAGRDRLFALAEQYGVAVPTEADVAAERGTPQDIFSAVPTSGGAQDAQDYAEQIEDTSEDAERRVRDVLATLAAGGDFHGALRSLARDAVKPAREIVRERVVTLGAPGATPAHVPQRVGSKRAGELFGVAAPHDRLSVALWDAPDAPAIDDAFEWHADTAAILCQLRRGRNVFLTGPAGTGKTSWPAQFAARTGRPFARISCNDQTDAAALVGMTAPKAGGGTEWRDGALTAAIRRPGTVVLIDEPSTARPGALMVLQSVLDSERVLTVDETGERVPVADGVLFVLADNTAGSGDASGAYEGTRRMNRATLDRCGVTVPFGYLDAATEARVLTAKTGCKPDVARALIAYAAATRTDAEKGTVTHGVGIRRLIAWAELVTDGIDTRRAWELTVYNTAAEDDRETLAQLFATHVDAAAVNRVAWEG